MEQLVGDESGNVEEMLSRNLAAVSSQFVEPGGTVGPELDQGRVTSVCPGLTTSADVEGSRCEVFSRGGNELDRILRDELGGSHVTSTPVKGLWPIYSKRRSSVLEGHEVRPCKSLRFEVADTIESVGGGNISRSGMTEASGGVEGSDFTSGGFSTLEAIAKNELTNKMEDCLDWRRVMAWFVCHMWRQLLKKKRLEQRKGDIILASLPRVC